ncbi:putative nrps-like enzyme [Diplodia seriata]|uniref:Putative nrps-like enzyme n=1 Tax=Diplodia seriata TaxID=420778 RepID=A0A0G2E5X4_9PEZI|nr:putative nrps-like enzyme [Diplodia seriata]
MSATATVTITPPTATTVSAPSTIDELIRAQAARADDPVLVAYPATDVDDFEQYTAKRLNRYADAAAAKYKSLGLAPADPTSASDAPVVALLAPSSFEVIVTILAVSRLGWALLFLSPRLPAAAHARLLETCRCGIIIAAPEQQDSVPQIQAALPPTSSLTSIAPITRTDYRMMPPPPPSTTTTTTTTVPRASSSSSLSSSSPTEKTAWIIHSSGSTGFPKPIPLSHRALLANFAKGLGLRAFCASPLFHSHGLMELFRCAYRGVAMWMANHARAVTAANLVRAMRAARPELVTAVPSETGAIMSSLRPPSDTSWSYLRLPPSIAPHILMDEISPGVYECVALPSLPSRGAPANCDDPPDSYRTRDLFARHPTHPDWWRYLTRLDDRLTLTNGEKILPLPIEGAVRQCPRVAEAVVFGAGRAVPGMLVFRGAGAEGEADQMGDAEFVEAIWGDVEAANARAESFSRIPKELVVAMPAGTEWPRTDKGTAVRQRVYDVFKDVIEEAYARFEQRGLDREEHGGGPLLALEAPELEEWLLEKFRVELGARLQSAEADIFAAGVDSLQTMRMWSLIRKTLDLGSRRDELSQNVVYEKGNVKTLARHLYGLRTGEAMDQSDEDELLAMQELVDEFSAFDPHIPGDLPAPDGEVVLLTGATGGLGAHILHALLTHPPSNLTHIYALARAPSASTAQSRILTSLSTRGLSLPPHTTPTLWTALPYTSLSAPDLSLPPPALATLRARLTCVVHAAWPVNFALPVRAFRPHVAGLHALLDRLCLRNMSWLPIDVAAASILDIALPVGGWESGAGGVRDVVEDDAATVYHILNPQTFHWTRDFISALRRTGMLPSFEVVSPAEWLEKLRDSDPDVQRNPSRKLLGFWED